MVSNSKSVRYRALYNKAWTRGFFVGLLGVAVGLAMALYVVGCGPDALYSTPGPKGDPGKTCTVKQETLGAVISCPDGTSAFISNGTSSCPCNKKH